LCGVAPPTFEVVNNTRKKVCQLTGPYDYELLKIHGPSPKAVTPNATDQYRIFGLDLGASFEHKGELWFVFGDTFSNGFLPDESVPCDAECMLNNMHLSSDDGTNTLNPVGADSIAHTTDTDPEDTDCVKLQWVTKPSMANQFENNNLDDTGGAAQQAGLSDGNAMYTWLDRPDWGLRLGYSTNNGQSFTHLYDFKHPDFAGLHAELWEDIAIPGLASYGKIDWGVLFGLGPSWLSGDAYLAVVPLSNLQIDPASSDSDLHYLEKLDADGRPVWTQNAQNTLAKIVDTTHPDPQPGSNPEGCIGTFRAHYSAELEAWIGIYDCSNAIYLVSAALPWGPWSDPIKDEALLFDPFLHGGYCGFMHAGPAIRSVLGCTADQDIIYGDRKDEDQGLVYAPNIIERYTVGNRNSATVYFNFSMLHPYNDVLLKAQLNRK